MRKILIPAALYSAACVLFLILSASGLRVAAQTPAMEPEPITKDAVADAGASKDRYRIGFEDVLQVNVYRHPELSQTLSVATDGTIILPRINEPIVAVCKTERELSATISELYKSYLRNPFVNVRAVEQRSQPFAVIGAVNKPGSFYLNRRVRLLELIALAGGPDVEKSGQRIQVARLGNRSACVDEETEISDVEMFAYRINDVLGGVDNPWMEPGDIVSVLEAEEAYVVGEVYEPAKIVLKEPITLSQAIAKAGGITATAKTGKVRIQRQQAGSVEKTVLVFDLKQIAQREIEDPVIRANDIIEVPTDNGKVLTRGLIKALVGGLGNIFYRVPF
jgi:polysaccharide export outer membrane protein